MVGILGQQQDFSGILNSPQMQGLAQGLLMASGPSKTPISLGQAMGYGMQQGNQLEQQQYERMIQQLTIGLKLKEAERQAKQDELAQKLLGGDMGGTGGGTADNAALMAKYGALSGNTNLTTYAKFLQDQKEKDPQYLADKKLKEEQAKAQADAAANLPNVVSNAENTLNVIDQMVGSEDGTKPAHPGFSDAVGAKNLFSGQITSYIPFTPVDPETGAKAPIAGTDAANFTALYKQLGGKNFLQAYQDLKGGGQISNVEGAKAQSAINRMKLAQSEAEFKAAAKDYRDVIKAGVDRARAAAKGDFSAGNNGASGDWLQTPSGTKYKVVQ